jgi:hypothetical protein
MTLGQMEQSRIIYLKILNLITFGKIPFPDVCNIAPDSEE